MKKVVFSIVIALFGAVAMSGCIKHATDMTINPSMTATIDVNGEFTAATVQPSTYWNQVNDTGTTLIITADASLLQQAAGAQILLAMNKYKAQTGTFSIVSSQAGAEYVHADGTVSVATSGFVSITKVTSNEITGYFQFVTVDGHSVTNGTFTVGKP